MATGVEKPLSRIYQGKATACKDVNGQPIENFEEIHAERVQVFPDTLTIQDLKMIPLSELPDNWNKAELFNTPAQNL